MKRIITLFFVVLLGAACSSGGTDGAKLCTPGVSQECACEDGTVGNQTCLPDGQSFSFCAPCNVGPGEDTIEPPEDTTEPGEDTTEPGEDTEVPLVCLLNNCTSDDHCTGCSDGRQTCLLAENRCVACDPNDPESCPEGEVCSSWGICNDQQLTCPTDAEGNPTVVCNQNADCKACSPMNQVCDPETHKCQACSATNTSHCLQSQYCKDGVCSDKCPKSCNLDNDCMFCGSAENPAHACNNHKCSECSKTWPCEAGMVCLPNGVCYPPCGLPGPEQGTCITDGDCQYCGDPKTPGLFECKKPANDPDGHGFCIPPAEGCEDLGTGVAVLPEPWSDYTQLCSNDGNCDNVAIDLNVGKLIKDLVGSDSIDVGIADLTIGDPTISYGMHECAEIKLTDNINCGICVPCQEDSDCAPIDVDPFVKDLFPDDPLASIAGAILIDLLWGELGDNSDGHFLNFYCQPVALGYGVCAPCTNPLMGCGKTEPQPGGDCPAEYNATGEGTCVAYDVALSPECGPCVEAVCANDAYCCETVWDSVCVGEVDEYCTTPCGGVSDCAADICDNPDLPAQQPGCGSCVEAVCDADPFCCNGDSGAWDAYCVEHANTMVECDAVCGGGGGCIHSECDTGAALTASCSPCADAICTADPYCCNNEWDNVCVEAALVDDACTCSI
jgi:hypothetical protein